MPGPEGNVDLELPVTLSWKELRNELAEAMVVAVTELKVVYTISHDSAVAKDLKLNCDIDVVKLSERWKEIIKGMEDTKPGKGRKKPLIITIKDRRTKDEIRKGSGSATKGKVSSITSICVVVSIHSASLFIVSGISFSPVGLCPTK